jgi:hypothetical protein
MRVFKRTPVSELFCSAPVSISVKGGDYPREHELLARYSPVALLALTFHKRAVMLWVKSASENLRRNRHFGSAEFLDAASP